MTRISTRTAASLLLCSLFPLHSAAAEAARPNFVLVLADDQGYGDMGYTGHPHAITPNFDAMAANAMRFDGFHAAHPVCSPTRVSILTGRDPNRAGCHAWGGTLREGDVTFANLLGDAGYHTAHFGKWHVGSVLKEGNANPAGAGFDRWVSAPNFYENDPTLADQGVATAFEGESSLLTMDLAVEWIAGLPRAGGDGDGPLERPFAAVVWFGSPHHPWISAPEFLEPYKEMGLSGEKAHFLGEVTGMDAAMGRLNEALAEMGIKDDTVVWYTSDNGALRQVGSAGPYRGYKGEIWQGGLRVPALLQWPAVIREPVSVGFPASTIDMLPTLLELAGVELPDGHPALDGTSLAPWIANPAEPPAAAPDRGIGFWYIPAPGRPVRSELLMRTLLDAGNDLDALDPETRDDLLYTDAGDMARPRAPDFRGGHAAWLRDPWKLHRTVENDGTKNHKLFNLADDPAESADVAEEHPEILEKLSGELEAWQADVIHDLNHPPGG